MAASLPTLAAHAWLFTNTWDAESGSRAIAEAGRQGFVGIEIPVVSPSREELRTHRAALSRAGVAALCRTVLRANMHLPLEAERSFHQLRRVLDAVELLESRVLVASFGWTTSANVEHAPTRAGRALVVEVLAEMAEDARERGITLAVEPGNRYETRLYNTLSDGSTAVLAAASPALRIAADTRTLQMEETNLRHALIGAADLLACVTIRESHGGEAGTGTIVWDEVWQGLAQIAYDGWLVYRCDTALSPTQPPEARSWRSDLRPGSAAALSGLTFLRDGVRRMQTASADPSQPISPEPPRPDGSTTEASSPPRQKAAKPKSPPAKGTTHTGKGAAASHGNPRKTAPKPPSGKSYRTKPGR